MGLDRRPRTRTTATRIYVEELIAPGTSTPCRRPLIHAFADHGEIAADTVTGTYADAEQVMARRWPRSASTYDDVVDTLEREGVEKFEASWQELIDGVDSR